MTERPRWVEKRDRRMRFEPEVVAMYKVVGVIAVGLVIWAILARL